MIENKRLQHVTNVKTVLEKMERWKHFHLTNVSFEKWLLSFINGSTSATFDVVKCEPGCCHVSLRDEDEPNT